MKKNGTAQTTDNKRRDNRELSPLENIIIRGARVHNLKNISVSIPRNKLVVITGLSGSGKSSLAFDTLFAEGQRRYVESLSSYARQFLGKLDKPDVDSISGISPAVAIEQKVTSRTSRSTVGTTTEIYDYIKLLYARIGRTFSPVSGEEVKRHRPSDILEYILSFAEDQRFYLLSPITVEKKDDLKKKLEMLVQQGFVRVKHNGVIRKIEEVMADVKQKDELFIVIDRFTAAQDDENQSRIADSSESAFFEGRGVCVVELADDPSVYFTFSNKFEADGILFEEPSVHLFSFNNPVGACKTCEGFGSVIGIDENLVIPDKRLSVYQDAIACWKGDKMNEWKNQLVHSASKFSFPIHKPWKELTSEQRELVWNGNKFFEGLHAFFRFLESESYKIQYRVMLSRYRGKTLCPECKGTRLRKDANYVKIAEKGIFELVNIPVKECLDFFSGLRLTGREEKIAHRLLIEIKNRLKYLTDVGLEYLTLNRLSNTLSGGESQRINLATSLGSSLVGSIYILDEPSIGLHPRDTQRLIGVLNELRNQGNSVIVVEHDEEIMRAADVIIDMGPEAGSLGGNVVFTGTLNDLLIMENTLTAEYLSGKRSIKVPAKKRNIRDRIVIRGARANNLKNIDVEIPLRCFTVISGVSGSGKSSLVSNLVFPALQKYLSGFSETPCDMDALEGDISTINAVEFVDQHPIGKSSRSNPVTYVRAYDEIRALFAQQSIALQRGYKASHFSFNVEGGRCETCEGEGFQTIEMQFMADIKLVCDSCKGKRFKDEVLEVLYYGKSIADVLEMTVDDAMIFFDNEKNKVFNRNILSKLNPLQQTGLGYITLGQSSSSLSGGEAQRIKLASFLGKGGNDQHTVFIFDEPTTGLHFHDVRKLMDSFQALLNRGHSIIAIEHNMDVIRCADWLIDLGPEGGERGGEIVFTGRPDDAVGAKESYTGLYISNKKRPTLVVG
ncbi:MAG: excinuclease ABC subunit UvrA [Crocinitomicaceae bacterium]|nr:excinuclease ABC subunit UvrA [Crocinitomicaceae bacterium]